MIRNTYNYLKFSIWCKDEYEEVLDNMIKNNDFVILGLTWCPWTMRAKTLLKKEYNIDPIVIAPDAITNSYKLNILYCACKRSKTTYVPQIWIKGNYIGDFENLYKMHHRKQLI